MGNGQVTPWNVLSGAISARVNQARERAQKQKDQEQQTEYKAWEGILTNPNSTQDERDRALAELRKSVPKETVPAIEAYHKVLSLFHKRRQAQGPGAQGPGAQRAPGGGPMAPGGAKPSPAAAVSPGGAPQTLGSILSAVNDPQRQIDADMKAQVAAAKAQIAGMDAGLAEAGFSPEERKEMIRRKFEGAAGKPREQKVVVRGSDGKPHPGTYNLDTGVTTVEGQTVKNPEIMWAGEAKPRQAWRKEGDDYVSVLLDSTTNQEIPGTEQRGVLPPAQYLDKVTQGQYFYTDDAGNVGYVPYTRTRGVNAPEAAPGQPQNTGSGVAVPPAMRTPRKGAGVGTPQPTGATKDAGVLSPAGQKAAMTTAPVLESTNRLLQKIHDAGLDDNNQVGYLFTPSVLYKLGYQSDKELADDIAGLKLEGVIAAASALQGTSRSISALRLAMQHTPEPYKDSPKLMRTKLTEIKRRLDAVMQDIKKYGGKRTGTSTIPDITPPPADTPPSGTVTPPPGAKIRDYTQLGR